MSTQVIIFVHIVVMINLFYNLRQQRYFWMVSEPISHCSTNPTKYFNDVVTVRCGSDTLFCFIYRLRLVAGFFLHVGYSIADQYLVEGHSALSFQPWNVADKLAALINADSAEQV